MALLAHVARGLAGCGSGVRDADDVPAMRGAARLGLVLRDLQLVEAVSVILYCRLCDVGTPYAGAIPERCASCGRITKWSTSAMRDRQAAAIMWTAEDRRLLRGFRIDPEG